MHVLFISACEKKALKRTRAILDSYALRTGERAWASPITLEGLREVRAALKRSATRQTAVACYRNDGRMRMKLLWVVGSRDAFGPDGHYPLGTTTVKIKAPVADWVRMASLLAQAAGWCHDFGKASRLFQQKLSEASCKTDCIRHEWISMRVLQAMRAGNSWDDAWEKVGNRAWLESNALEEGIESAWAALDYLVATHHRLLGPKGKKALPPDHTNHFSGEPLDRQGLLPKAPLSSKLFDAVRNLIKRVEKLAPDKDRAYWRVVAIIARASLILADHVISAQPKTGESELYANTHEGRLSQPLDWHLQEVAHAAGDAAYRIATLRLPGLSEEAVEAISQPAEAPYLWQNRAAEALAAFRERSDQPMLVFNIAGTGSGKTRMNARAATVLAQGQVRFAVALNLRTLTLQTGDAFRTQLQIGTDEMACIIGDKVTLALHESQRQEEADTDGNEAEPDLEASGEDFTIPGWLERFAEHKPAFRAVVGAPILVSTVDFLAAAGMPHRQGHHVSALLRLADSDLVLDEVDSYDPQPLVAILRLVQMAALFGRNVICSTATLAEPVAMAIYTAYHSGARLRAALTGTVPAFGYAFIDNYTVPKIIETGAEADFLESYRDQISHIRPALGKRSERIPYLQTIEEQSTDAWRSAILESVNRLHRVHAWIHGPTGKRISFGLVRIANIGSAIAMARFLATNLPHARVACYHSQDNTIQRFLKEKRLDGLLNRKRGNDRIEKDAELFELLSANESTDIPFIVVATPVEEIGRDHDFDWAVIEPSSTRSIVQTAGRVNRHRRSEIREPNIALLQYNYRWTKGEKKVFHRPGFEVGDEAYPSHDLKALLNWDSLRVINAGLMFDGHLFSELDNKSIRRVLDLAARRLFDVDAVTPWWISQSVYDEYPLREQDDSFDVSVNEEERYFFLLPSNGEFRWVDRSSFVQTIPRVSNDWLVWSPEQLFEECRRSGIDWEKGMRVSIRHYRDETAQLIVDRSFGFSLQAA